MVKIAYLLLCHKNADYVIAQAKAYSRAGDVMAIHFDKRASAKEYAKLVGALGDDPNVAFAKRVACGWGEYSLVQASFNLLDAARAAFEDVTHYYLVSGDCYPIKSASFIRSQLAPADRDFIEINDFMESDWIKTGIKEERLIYRHLVNERKHKKLFYNLMKAQRKLGLERSLPKDLTIKIGSQWWLLRAETVEAMYAFLKKRQDVLRFFSTTWIPDEIAFQTIIAHCADHSEIVSRPPTTLVFTDYGMPVTFYADHLNMIRKEPRFFARKITEHDADMRQAMLDHYVDGDDKDVGAEMVGSYYLYLSNRGRQGRRLAPRFWEKSATLDDGKEVLVIACKKWHIGEHMSRVVHRVTGMETLGYVFDQDQPLDMELGNLEVGKEKRGRHRRAFLSLLFDVRNTSKLALCIDPARDDVVRDIADTDCRMRVLLIETGFSREEYVDHAERVGLMSRHAGEEQRNTLVEALTNEFSEESGRLRKVDTGRMDRLAADQNRVEMAASVARFLRVSRDEVEAVVRDMESSL